jgi:NADH-quinone oxidoreductase subunit I
MKHKKSYWGSFWYGLKTSYKGLLIAFKHFKKAYKRHSPTNVLNDNYFKENKGEGLITLFYPYEAIPLPDNTRTRLHNEMDDCIVCDKCAKVCPVDCIEIEPIKATEQIGTTSDGSPIRLYAARFDIDMAKCCYCGLCTTVCPTECLTMTKVYDYSEFDVKDMIYHFANLTPEEAQEKKDLLVQFQKEKADLQAQKNNKSISIPQEENQEIEKENQEKPVFKPKIKPLPKVAEREKENIEDKTEGNLETTPTPKPVFKPKIKPLIKKEDKNEDKSE